MHTIFQFIGLDTSIVANEKVTEGEKKTFLKIGVLLLLSSLITFFGVYHIFYFVSTSIALSIIMSAFWTFIYVNLYRLIIVISINRSNSSKTLGFGTIISSFLLMLVSITGGIGFLSLVIHGVFINDLGVSANFGVIKGLNSTFNFIKQKGEVVSFLAYFGLIFFKMLPLMLAHGSKKIDSGGYLELVNEQIKNIIIGNYLVFKTEYSKVLKSGLYNKQMNSEVMPSNIGDDNFLNDKKSPYDFYEAFQDPPFNTKRKVEW